MVAKRSSSLRVLVYNKGKAPNVRQMGQAHVVLEDQGDGHFKVFKSKLSDEWGMIYPNGYMSIYINEQKELLNGTKDTTAKNT